ncbi:hypothetical protein Nepgr_014756 [Nepenthes gracilis]|uniref:Uncharacterized protein n=1 Tax=Nepenthes gracilis TaxID=150966 RepID=A0AAD3XQT1_NEPGR|nr:hypothetical protein Nepgr_014756 [Nepenthes gracilis]
MQTSVGALGNKSSGLSISRQNYHVASLSYHYYTAAYITSINISPLQDQNPNPIINKGAQFIHQLLSSNSIKCRSPLLQITEASRDYSQHHPCRAHL